MDRFLNALKGHAAAQAQAQGQPRFGTVTSYNPHDGTAKVQIQPEGVQTGWLPVLSAWVGNGWGLHSPLSTGEQVLVLPQDGDAEHGVIVGRAWSDQMRPPTAAPGDMVIQHQTGSMVTLTANGQITVKDASGTSMVFSNNGTVTLTGNLLVTGNISDSNGAHGTFASLRSAYDGHTHTGVAGGTGTTAGPNNVV